MSSSDAQPPLTRRQARERERAGEATGALPVVPPPTVPATTPASSEAPRRRPGSHAAPLRPAAAGGPRPLPAQPTSDSAPPASATEIVPGTGMTRRQLRAMRAAEDQAERPVPLQAPSPQSSDRTVADVLDTVAVVEGRQHPDQVGHASATPSTLSERAPEDTSAPEDTTSVPGASRDSDSSVSPSSSAVTSAAVPTSSAASTSSAVAPESAAAADGTAPAGSGMDAAGSGPDAAGSGPAAAVGAPTLDDEPAPDQAALDQATAADGSPTAIEPFETAAEHGEEPRRRRSTWAPPSSDDPAETPETGASDRTADSPSSDGGQDRAAGAGAGAAAGAGVPDTGEVEPALRLPLPSELPSPREPVVFPLDLDDDTSVVPAASGSGPTDQVSDDQVRGDEAQGDGSRGVPESSDVSGVPGSGSAAPGDAPSGASRSRRAAVVSDGASSGSARSADPSTAADRPVEPKPVTTAFEAPAGHWSRQGEDIDDRVHESETGIRRVTDTSTSALILPNSALGDVTGALNATGEVILTGSIDLPKSLSSTGSHRPIDGAEVDRLLDQHDEQPETDASPVRASRAVSSHTSTRAVVLAAAKPKESRGPLILGVSAGGVAVIAVVAIVWALFGIR